MQATAASLNERHVRHMSPPDRHPRHQACRGDRGSGVWPDGGLWGTLQPIMNHKSAITDKDKIVSFLWQHCLLLISLFILTLGVAFKVRCASCTPTGNDPLLAPAAGFNNTDHK